MSSIKSFILQNNMRIFTDMLSATTGGESVNWLYGKMSKHDKLMDISSIQYMYYYDGQDDFPFYDKNTRMTKLPRLLSDMSTNVVLNSEKVFKKHFEFNELITIVAPDPPFTRLVKFDITPIGKPTWQKSDRWASRKPRNMYLAYKEHLSLLANQQDFVLPDKFKVTFFLPVAKSHSKNKKIALHNQPCHIKPDGSNMLKGLEDILLPDGDEAIWNVHIVKRYTIGNGDGTGGYIIIEY